MADRKIFGNQGPTKPDLPSSLFDLSHACNMTARLGKLYPCMLYEVPAKSTIEIEPRCGFDLHPLNFPIQSNVRCHIKVFKAPMRILWKNYEDWFGQHGDHVMPYIKRNYYWHGIGSLADYMGIPSSAIVVNGQNVDVHTDNYLNLYVNDQYVIERRTSEAMADANGYGLEFVFKYPVDPTGFVAKVDYVSTEQLDLSTIQSDFFRFSVRAQYAFEPSTNYRYVDDISAEGSWDVDRSNLNERINLSGVTAYRSVFRFNVDHNTSSLINATIDRLGSAHVVLMYGSRFYGSPYSGFIVGASQSSVYIPDPNPEKEGTIVSMPVVGRAGLQFTMTYRAQVAIQDDGENSHFYVHELEGETEPRLPINALPFRMYEDIYQYFFNNERVTPFKIDGQETYNKFFTNDEDGADTTTPLELKSVPFEYDIFTTCVKTPQFGNAPLVGITTNDEDASAIMHMVPDVGDEYDIGVNLDGDANIIGISNYEDVADRPSVMRLQEAIKFGISINDLRNVSALQRFQERYLKAGNKYANIVYEFYGTNPPVGDHYPEYLGGITEDIIVDKITNVAKSEGNELGEFAGQASFRMKSNHKIKCFCTEPSYIMAVCYFTVTPSYPQMLPKLFMRSNLLDYYNPQFANIGPQPIMKNQLCPLQLDASHLHDVFGYNAPWVDYKMMLDEVHGDFRGTMANFLIQRRFAAPPSLNDRFINIHSEDLTDVFSVLLDTDKIFGQIWFDMRAKLPMPRYSIPRIV